MRFVDTVKPVVVAPVAAAIVYALFEVFVQKTGRMGGGFVIALAWVWALSLAAAVMFVVPVLACVPRLRRPPVWFAALWGVLVAGLFSALVLGPDHLMRASPVAHLGLGVSGAAAGFLYAVLVRRRPA